MAFDDLHQCEHLENPQLFCKVRVGSRFIFPTVTGPKVNTVKLYLSIPED